eukprot:6358943-Prymnesium_polylepis.1
MHAVNAGAPLDCEKAWTNGGQRGTVSTATAELYRQLQHRVTEEVLRLPPLTSVVRTFEVRLQQDGSAGGVADYTSELEQMQRLRIQMNTDRAGRGALLIALLAKLQKLRQVPRPPSARRCPRPRPRPQPRPSTLPLTLHPAPRPPHCPSPSTLPLTLPHTPCGQNARSAFCPLSKIS